VSPPDAHPGLPPILLVGAGRMGGAMFAGWAARGLSPSVLVDPGGHGPARPQDHAVGSLAELPGGFAPAAVVLAIKPQMAAGVLPGLGRVLPPGIPVLSILAGLTAARLCALLGTPNPVVRAMPNTPAAIGQGMTVAFAGAGVTAAQRALCQDLLAATGDVAWVEDEALIDPITAVSGCGPAYVFLLAELLEREGAARGIPPALARQLARKTVSGAGALLAASAADSAELRRAVTSPNGVTERALAVLMAPEAWPAAIGAALEAATHRSRELAG
jgi:pyrroline-5-carboxylate reductase